MKLSTLFLLSVASLLVSCARGPVGDSGAPGTPGPAAPLPPPVAAPNAIQIAISEYNEQRVAIGQDPVTSGLSCSLYTVPSTTTQIVGATLTTVGSWTYTGVFNDANGNSAPGLSILPPLLRPIYTSWYVVKCSGLFVVPASGFYSFDLSDDDGANLAVNGALINNDGVHSISTKSAVKYLARGVVSFSLDYLDAGGSHALQLKSGGSVVSADHFYH